MENILLGNKQESYAMAMGIPDAYSNDMQGPSCSKNNLELMDSSAEDMNIEEDDGLSYKGNPELDMENLYANLREYLAIEHKFQPKIYLPTNPQNGEISSGVRDGAAHVLRCLKVWYDLPPEVLFHAINLLDRFLTKMKVRPCHISCISVSCMHIAITACPTAPQIPTDDLVTISQCKCTVGDVSRMSAIIADKLGLGGPGECLGLTGLHWLRLFGKLMAWAAEGLGVHRLYAPLIKESELVNKLEILVCDASCVNIRICELALVLLYIELENGLMAMQKSELSAPGMESDMSALVSLASFVGQLQGLCGCATSAMSMAHAAVVRVLAGYDARRKTPHRQRLVWKLSSRTLKVLRPTDRLTSLLPTIAEQHFPPSPPSPPRAPPSSRSRSGSESSDDLNETSDWPRSPLLPVYCSDT